MKNCANLWKMNLKTIFNKSYEKPLFVDICINKKVYVFLIEKSIKITNNQVFLKIPKFMEKDFLELNDNYKIKIY